MRNAQRSNCAAMQLERVAKHALRGFEIALVDCVADGVESNRAHTHVVQSIENARQVSPCLVVLDVEVDLLGGERRPEQDVVAARSAMSRERQARTRGVECDQIGLARTVGEHP